MSEQSFGRGALAAGGLAAIVASACCLDPLVLVALAFSGAGIGNSPGCGLRAGRGLRRAASEIRLQNDFLGRGGIGRGSSRLPLHTFAVQLKRAPS
jgi:MerT mercuric transport protein